MPNVDIYKGQIKLGAGVVSNGSTTVTGVARIQDRTSPTIVRRNISNWSSVVPTPVAFAGLGRNVTLMITTVGANLGKTWGARVLTDPGVDGQSITIDRACPYA